MAAQPASVIDGPMIEGQQTYGTITEHIGDIPAKSPPAPWYFGAAFGFGLLGVMVLTIGSLLYNGIGIWGVNVPVGWGFDIINFVWWIGIGHAGTLISAILLLLRQQWRTSINRFAETMTLFAVMCAGLFPLLHTGRPWVAYWLVPYPNIMAVWPNFRSPLVWDVFAVTTYLTVSALFWYVGLIPDLATMRDRAKSKVKQVVTGMLAMGWRNSAAHWFRYETAYLLLAGLSTPLVISVHSIVSLDFAVSLMPGWHTTIFPPYFVAGAIYSGFAMVLTFMIPVRRWYKMENFVTMKHIDWMAKVMLATGLIVLYGYGMEAFMAWYSGSLWEELMFENRTTGRFGLSYWLLILCNGVIPQLLWLPRFRHHMGVLFFISLVINVGMWLERFVIVVTSLHHDFLPSSWGMYYPTIWDLGMFAGTIGFFTFMMFLFLRFLPMIAVFEMRDLWHKVKPDGHGDRHAPVPTGKS
ncbi:MAG: polysulfide reductase NrfD [Armatimonadetes bacterium]|nr:polysulfide reductase NrfD [Armatimonadota bacterium]